MRLKAEVTENSKSLIQTESGGELGEGQLCQTSRLFEKWLQLKSWCWTSGLHLKVGASRTFQVGAKKWWSFLEKEDGYGIRGIMYSWARLMTLLSQNGSLSEWIVRTLVIIHSHCHLGYSSVVEHLTCRSRGPWFKSGCPLWEFLFLLVLNWHYGVLETTLKGEPGWSTDGHPYDSRLSQTLSTLKIKDKTKPSPVSWGPIGFRFCIIKVQSRDKNRTGHFNRI